MKKAITLFLAVMLVLTSIPAFAYSTTGAGMFSAYYQGDSASPWQAEVTFEKTLNNTFGINDMSKPIQYLDRTEKQIRTNAYFTKLPSNTTDAKLYTTVWADDILAAVSVAPVNKAKLTASNTIDMAACVAEYGQSATYYLRAYVWDGMTPMTQLREISNWSFNIDKIKIDGTEYTHSNAAEGVFIDNGMGIIDIDVRNIANRNKADLVIGLAFGTNRKLIANGQEYSYDSEAGGFVLNDVSLTAGLPFTLKAAGSTAHYYINPKAKFDFTPNEITKAGTDSNYTTTYAMPTENGAQTKINTSTVYFQMNGIYMGYINSNNYGQSQYKDTYMNDVYHSFYNDNGTILYRMFSNGAIDTVNGPASNLSTFYLNPKDSAKTAGSYVFEIKFKAKEVPNKSDSAAAATGVLHDANFELHNTKSSGIILGIDGTNDGIISAKNQTSTRGKCFFGNSTVQNDTFYTIRAYARRIDTNTVSVSWYSYDPSNGYVHVGGLDDVMGFDSYKTNYKSTPNLNRIALNVLNSSEGKGFANDIYIDHVRVYETAEAPAV